MDGYVFAVVAGKLRKRVFRDGEQSSGAASAIVNEVGRGADLIGDRHEDQAGHEMHNVSRREVLPGLLVVLFVETPDELLEDRAHTVVVQTRETHGAVPVQDGPGAEVNRAVQELLQQESERVALDQRLNLVAEFELVQYFLDVR